MTMVIAYVLLGVAAASFAAMMGTAAWIALTGGDKSKGRDV